VAETPEAIVIGHVGPSEEMIAELIEQSAYGARIVSALRDRMLGVIAKRSRVPAIEVLSALEREIAQYEAGATREAWVKDAGRE
jgi:hypothetical protein